jgi:phage shock protein A
MGDPPLIQAHERSLLLALQASEVAAELEASRAEVAQIRQQQEAERARVKKAISEMKRKIDGCVQRCQQAASALHATKQMDKATEALQPCLALPRVALSLASSDCHAFHPAACCVMPCLQPAEGEAAS